MPRPLLITGASGKLGSYLLRELSPQSWTVHAWSGSMPGHFAGVDLQPVDLTEPEEASRAFRAIQPAVVLHTAAMSSLADCQREPERAARINIDGTALIARLAAEHGARLVHVSTDLVFDGEAGPYTEKDNPRPLSVYSRTKLAAEEAALRLHRTGTLVIRISLLLGCSLRPKRLGFFDQQAAALRAGQVIHCFADEWRSPLSYAACARILLLLAERDHIGLLHLGGPERLSRLEIGQRLARQLGVPEALVQPCLRQDLGSPEPRPRDTSLCSELFRQWCPDIPWPTWEMEAFPGQREE